MESDKELIGYEYTELNKMVMYPEKYSKIMKVLKTTHNAGFFSCCSIRLIDIMIYFNDHQGLPDIVDSSQQFGHYKSYVMENLIPYYFMDKPDIEIPYNGRVDITLERQEPQFSSYHNIRFDDIKPFIYKFFTPSIHVGDYAYMLREKYNIDYNNTCAVFYRGNDKYKETKIAPYREFIEKAREVYNTNPGIVFLVQPDEGDFLRAFYKEFPNNTIHYEETPYTDNRESCMVFELPQADRKEYGLRYFAAVYTLSQCKHLITHSGNGGNWAVFYRGHSDNVHQWLIDKWV